MGKSKKKEETYEVEAVVASRGSGKKIEYQVKWVGYSSKENTWEPLSNLTEVQDLIDAYEKKSKAPPKPAAAPPKAVAKPAPSKSPPKKAPPPPKETRASASKPTRGEKRGREEAAPEPKPAKKAKKAEPPKAAPKAKEVPKPASKATPIEKKSAGGKKKEDKIDVLSISKLLQASMSGLVSGGKPSKEKVEKAPKPAAAAPKPAAKEAAGKKKKAAAILEDVAEVEKIAAMRVTPDGGLEFQIVWNQKGKVGKTTWEPEDNIMDDDLVDDFEEAQQIKAYGSDEIKTGSQVEVKNVMEGFQNSWTLATVTSKKGDKFAVSYDKFVDDDGNSDTEKGVDRTRLRLVPDKVSGWTPLLGEIIEINEDDCWWEAKVQAKKGKTLTVMYRVSDEVKNVTLGAKTRPCSWLKLIAK